MTTSTVKFKFILGLMILMLLSGSIFSSPMTAMAKSSSGSTTVLVNKSELKKRTINYVSQFIKGNFDDFYKDSTKQLQGAITTDILKQGWNAITALTGKPGKSISCTYVKQNDFHIVMNKISCTLYNITVTISYNSKGKPEGIRTNFLPKDPPKPQATDKWDEFSVTVGDKKLPGMLTLPKNVPNPPVVIMIQGSGSSDMNEAVGAAPNRPFEDIAHGLASQGVATLRYNKRTYQYPAGGGYTIQSEMLDDAAAAVKMLSDDKRIDTNRIYLLGHSLGGMYAPKIASDNPQIKGFISMAGSLRPFTDIMLDQNKAALDAIPSLTVQQKNDVLTQLEADIAKMSSSDNSSTNIIMDMPAFYWKSLLSIDNLTIAKNLTIPMLILQGSADFQVYQDKDYTLWETTLKDHNNTTYHLYEGLSHLFMPNQITKNRIPDISVYNAPNHVDPQVITDIAEWIKGL